MVKKIRICGGGSRFNSGKSRCKVPRGKIKAFILGQRGAKLPDEITAESLEKAFHADEPNRLYPYSTVIEYAPSGGEAQTSQTGYGPSKFTGLSDKIEAFTMDEYDMSVVANLLEGKNMPFDFWLINDSKVIFGKKGKDGSLSGAPSSAIYPGTQPWDTSGQESNEVISLVHSDYEEYLKNEDVIQVDFNILDNLKGLTEIEFLKVEGENKYKIVEAHGSLDVTAYYGQLIAENSSKVFDSEVTSAVYADGVLTITGTGEPKLKKPSILQEQGILWIEQIGTSSLDSGSDDDYVDPNA